MGSVARLAEAAGVPVVRVAGLELVRSTDAPALLAAFAYANIRVVGAEGFCLEDGETVRPAMNAILDLSGLDAASESIAEAHRFLSRIDEPDMCFAFAVEGPEAF